MIRSLSGRVAILLLAAVCAVFIGAALIPASHAAHAMESDCIGPACDAMQTSVAFCVDHCLSAAQAIHGLPSVSSLATGLAATTAAGAIALVFLVRAPGAVVRIVPFDAPSLRAVRSVVLRE